MFHRFIRTSNTLLLYACAAAPALSQTAPAANRLDEIIARDTLRVGTTGDYKPFTHKNPADGCFIGLDVEMGECLTKALGVKLEIVPTTWPTLMQDFATGRYGIAMSGVSVTLERWKKAFYSTPHQRDGKTPITRYENQPKYQTLAQIDQLNARVVVNLGGTNEKFAREHLKQAQIRVYPDDVTTFNEIVADRVDLTMADVVETKLQQKLHPELYAVYLEASFDFLEKVYLLPHDVVFKSFVDQWLRQTTESGEFAKRFDAWLAHPWGTPAKQAV